MDGPDLEQLAQELSLDRAREKAAASDVSIARVTWKMLPRLTPTRGFLDLLGFGARGLVYGWLQWRTAPELQTYHPLPFYQLRRALWRWRLGSTARSLFFFVFILSLFFLIPVGAFAVYSWARGGADARDARSLVPVVLFAVGVTAASLAAFMRLNSLRLPTELRPMLKLSLHVKSVSAVELSR